MHGRSDGAVAAGVQTLPVGNCLPDVESEFCLGHAGGAGKSGMNRFPPRHWLSVRIDYQRHYHSGELSIMGVIVGTKRCGASSKPSWVRIRP